MPENINDKGYRRMLSRKRNFLEFIKQHIAAPWVEQLREEDMEFVNSRFVTKDLKDRESDIIYKARIDDRDIYFFILLELQSVANFTMPFRFLEYMAEMYSRLFYDTDENSREQKAFRLPAIVPMVLYNGADEWSCVRSFKEYLSGYELFVPNVIDFEYLVINVNAPDESELANTPTLVNLAMLLDRKGDSKSFLRRIGTVRKMSLRLTPDEQTELMDWILDVIVKKIRGKVDDKSIKEIVESFNKGDESEMTYAIERIIDDIEERAWTSANTEIEAERQRAEAERQRAEAERTEAIKALKAQGVPDEVITRAFGTV
jgi:hypothetical protein